MTVSSNAKVHPTEKVCGFVLTVLGSQAMGSRSAASRGRGSSEFGQADRILCC